MYDGFSFCMLISFETPAQATEDMNFFEAFRALMKQKVPEVYYSFFPPLFLFF